MSAGEDWHTQASLNDVPIYLCDGPDRLKEEDDWKTFLGTVNRARDGSMVWVPIADHRAHLPSDELSFSSYGRNISPGIDQAYASTDESDTPFSTPPQTWTESGSPIVLAENLPVDPPLYDIGEVAQGPQVVRQVSPIPQSNHILLTSPSGVPPLPLQDGLIDEQMRLQFAAHNASGVDPAHGALPGLTPDMIQRSCWTVHSFPDHNQLGVARSQPQFQEMATFYQPGEPVTMPVPAAPYQCATSYSLRWAESPQNLGNSSEHAINHFRQSSASIGTQFDNEMDVDQRFMENMPILHSPAFVDTPSPSSSFETSRSDSETSILNTSHGHCVSLPRARLQEITGQSDHIPDSFLSNATSHVAKVATRSVAAARVKKRKTRPNVVEPNMTMLKTEKGGRPLGSKLSEDARAKAAQLRKDGVCWPCRFNRDSVSSILLCFA
jgi:hypothetical protein